ncbi:MAG: HAMP domain-containing sensor histidine kinase [Solirubrobacteraceae bacterium]
MSLRARMGLASGVAVAIAVIAVAVAAYAGASTQVRSQLDQSLLSLTGSIQARAGIAPMPGGPGGGAQADGGHPPSPGDISDPDEGLHLDADNGPAFGGASGDVTLIHADGFAYHPPGQQGFVPAGPRAKALAARGVGHYYEDLTVGGTAIRVLASGIGGYGALLVALPLHDVDRTLDQLLLLLAVIAAAGILFAAALGLVVARTALAPIARFTRQTEAIADNPERLETERLDVDSDDELGRLASSFNRTLEALAAAVQAQRNLVADASHELRTPIATIRANLQLMRDEERLSPQDRDALRADVIEELDELTALVADIVELARGPAPTLGDDELRLDEVVAAAVARTRRRAPELEIDADLEPTLIRGEGARIGRAVANLLDNAVKYGAAGERVEVALRDATLTVSDHGSGFHEQDLPFVFDRFHRAPDARSKPGSGLGLAIVRQTAEAHGGFAEAANAPGGGAILRVGFGPELVLDEPAPHDPVGSGD